MKINIKVDKDYEECLLGLIKKYGQRLAELNGFANAQMNYTEFIDNFVEKKTVADASIDGNANVGTKDACSLMLEMNKPHSKLLSFNKIFIEMKKKFGVERAKEWLTNEYIGFFYNHDAATTSFVPYCFSGDTKFLTKDGIKRLDEMCGKKVKVLNKNRGWEDAEVKSFGEAPLTEITFERYGVTKTVRATENHRWFVRETVDYKDKIVEYETKDLVPGMRIPFNATKTWSQVDPSPFGIAHGFFIGDGDKSRLRANFCGDKTALLPYFMPANIQGSETEYSVFGVPKMFRELPSMDETSSYLYGFLSGYFAADGCVDTKGRCTISSTVKKNLECVRDILCVLGMPVNEIRSQNRVSNLTNEEGTVYTLSLSSEYLKESFFIRPQHKERFIPNQSRKDRNWIVKSVKKTNDVEEVFCAVTEDTGSFTLDNNILTHNCFAYDIEDLVKKGLYFIDNFNSQPPKHLTTFTDFVGEFVSWTSNRTSGACGLPSFLVYSFYFWKKDCENGYYITSPEYYRDQEFQRIIFKLNQPYLRVNQCSFTNITIMDESYLDAIFGAKQYPDGSYIVDYIEELIEYQKAFMNKVSEIRSQNMFTFPVLTYSLLRKNGKFVSEDFAKWCCLHNMKWADSNFYISDNVTSLSNCCRLVSNIKETGYFNSIGGTALEVGSVKVNTINLARISYEATSKEDYINIVKDKTKLCLDVLDVIRHIIIRNAEKGLLPNYTKDILHIKSQYNTIGIIGVYETLQKFGMTKTDELRYTTYTDEGLVFAKDILKAINEVKDEYAANTDYSINIEEIPAERAAAILMEKDQFFYPDEAYELPLYGNQWIPLGVKTSIKERVRLCAELDKACNGGSILHANLDKPFANFDTAWEMLNYIADMGVPYFAFCTRISACESNHGFYGDTCPVCGKPKVTTYQRIVGFLTPVRTYSKERKAEFAMRDWMDLNNLQEI